MSLSNPFSPDLLRGQVWLITGGGTGIGRAVALLASELGAATVIASRRLEHLAPTARAIEAAGGRCLAHGCDIREPDQVDALVAAALEQFARIDVLVNNAGGQFPTPAATLTTKGWDVVIRNNLSGTWYVTQAVATRALIPGQGGAIVNVIANIFRGFPGMVHTGAARAGVDNLTKTLAVEWACHGVRVNAVAPGIIETEAIARYPQPIVERSAGAIPLKRLGTAEEVAIPIVFVGSPAASYITGETLYVDGAARLWGDLWEIPDP
jgi:citronellol/citronellal dehydrogenase